MARRRAARTARLTARPLPALTVRALAKINLSLSVVGRRADGYHELAGVMALVELADTLTLIPGSSGLRVDAAGGDAVPVAPSENLAWRGLAVGADGEPELACLTLEKRIPVGAGLGGGSSDAAAAWRLGRRLAGVSDMPTVTQLRGELAGIGADVPFFAAQVPAAYVTGLGEAVRPLDPETKHVVLAIPPFPLSTAAVFAELRPAEWSAAPPDAITPGRNDLLAPARRLRPELDSVFAAIRRAGGEPHLTGSGSACFAVTDDVERAAGISRRLRDAGMRTMQTELARTVPAVREVSADDEEDRP